MGEREPTRRHTGIARAIYGQILVTAVVAALSEDSEAAVGYLLLSAATTITVFWVAHVYAAVMARGIELQRRLQRDELRGVLAGELPMLETAVPTVAILLLGTVGVWSRNTTVSLAIGVGVVILFFWGLVFGRAAGRSWPSAVLSATITGGLGLVIVGLKAIVH
jgi:hypothetical protein